MSIYKDVFLAKKKSFSILIDPDKTNIDKAIPLIKQINTFKQINAILVGGSLVADGSVKKLIKEIKAVAQKPIILFPGNVNQVCKADAILFLSLISGRNPEYLIGQHVVGAPIIKNIGMESIPTGYMLVGNSSSTSYISNTTPLPADRPDLAKATAIAGEMMGNALIFMDAGSGSKMTISANIIKNVASVINIPLIIGGGIRTYDDAKKILAAGANCIVIGNEVENNTNILFEIANAVADTNKKL